MNFNPSLPNSSPAQDELYGYLVKIMRESGASNFLRHSIMNEHDRGISTDMFMQRLIVPFLEKMNKDYVFVPRAELESQEQGLHNGNQKRYS